MRIISGFLKSRRIAFPPLKDAEAKTRPTTDMARESLFNLLNNWRAVDEVENAKVLDLFSGTGAVGFEFISRGADMVHFVEKSSICLDSIKKHADLFDVKEYCTFFKMDVFSFLNSCTDKFDYVFIDPPYALPNIPKLPGLVFQANILNPDAIVIVEHDDRFQFGTKDPYWVESRSYGKSRFSFFQYTTASLDKAKEE